MEVVVRAPRLHAALRVASTQRPPCLPPWSCPHACSGCRVRPPHRSVSHEGSAAHPHTWTRAQSSALVPMGQCISICTACRGPAAWPLPRPTRAPAQHPRYHHHRRHHHRCCHAAAAAAAAATITTATTATAAAAVVLDRLAGARGPAPRARARPRRATRSRSAWCMPRAHRARGRLAGTGATAPWRRGSGTGATAPLHTPRCEPGDVQRALTGTGGRMPQGGARAAGGAWAAPGFCGCLHVNRGQLVRGGPPLDSACVVCLAGQSQTRQVGRAQHTHTQRWRFHSNGQVRLCCGLTALAPATAATARVDTTSAATSARRCRRHHALRAPRPRRRRPAVMHQDEACQAGCGSSEWRSPRAPGHRLARTSATTPLPACGVRLARAFWALDVQWAAGAPVCPPPRWLAASCVENTAGPPCPARVCTGPDARQRHEHMSQRPCP